MADLNFRISTALDAAGFKQAAKAFRDVDDEASGLGETFDNLNHTLEGLQTAFNGFIALQIVEFLRDVVNETIAAQQQQLQLKTRVDSTGTSFEANAPKIYAFLEGVQALTHVNKDELIPAMEILIERTHSVRKAQELLTLTVGIARSENKSYAEAAALVAGVMNNTPRAVSEAVKMLGLHKEAAKDNVAVMKELVRSFGNMAETISPAGAVVGDMKNQWSDMKQELGEGVTPALALVGTVGVRALNLVLGAARLLFNALLLGSNTIALTILAPFALVSKAAADMRDSVLASMEKEAEGVASANQVMVDALTKFGDERKNLADNYVENTKKEFDQLNDVQRQAIADGLAAAASGDQARYTLALSALDKQAKAQKKALLDAAADQVLSERDKAALLESVDNQMLAKRAALKAQYDKAEFDNQKNLMMSQIALTVDGSQQQLDARLKLLTATAAAERQQAQDSLLTEKERSDQMIVIANNEKAVRTKLYLEYYKAQSAAAIQGGHIVGEAIALSLAGQQNAWKSALSQILKMIINSTETAIMAAYLQGAAVEVAQKGWLGVASGAALIATVGGALSAVAGLIADPSSSPSTPSAGGGGGGGLGAAPTPSLTPAAANPQAQGALNVYIYGDTINDDAYVDRLAHKLSQAVNNRDIRLVATQINKVNAVGAA